MIKLGEFQELIIERFTSVGAFLNTESRQDGDVLLPRAQIPEDAKVGDKISVFIYNDSRDRIIATVNQPKISMGKLAHLTVVSSTKFGHFLDWGLEKDLFLPFAETIGSVEKGRSYLFSIYIDKSHRLCATMKIRDMLRTDSDYQENDLIEGTIYSINREIGAFVAVDDKFDGLIDKKELRGAYQVGESVEARVSRVLEDGKLNLSLRDRAYIQMGEDADKIVEKLKENQGHLSLNDKSSPQLIQDQLGMSKSAFKRAVGRLLREDMIEFVGQGISLKE